MQDFSRPRATSSIKGVPTPSISSLEDGAGKRREGKRGEETELGAAIALSLKQIACVLNG